VELLFAPTAEATLGPWAKEPEASYGLGWFVGGAPFGPAPVAFHPGATPDFGALVALDPSSGRGLAVLVNVGPRVAVPGAAGDIDRIGAGAVSLLTGSEPAVEGTVPGAYRLVAPVLVLLVLGAATIAVRRPPARARARRHGTTAAVAGAGALAVLAVPTLTLGWRLNWLWAPDLTVFAGLLGVALAVVCVRRLLALRPTPDPLEPAPASPTDDPPLPVPTTR
jgi:hypothetical protein